MSTPGTITEDALLDGAVTIFQPETGFRAGTDSVLLGGSVAELKVKGPKFAEFGCGVGGALFPAMFHLQDANFTAVEKIAAMAALTRRGAEANHVSDRLDVVESCVKAFAARHENSFDLVFSNPPYFEAGKLAAPGRGKEEAYIESISLDDWLKAMLFAARPQAYIVLIHRAAELARILTRLDKQAGQITLLPIRPYPGGEASRILVHARKGLRSGPVRMLAGLDLHVAKGGALSERAEGVLRGQPLEWR